MKLVLLIVPLIVAAAAQITDEKDCKCHSGFEAKPDPTSGFKCHGLKMRIIVPCNIVQRPKCQCTDATGILTDDSGTWCTQYAAGREIRRWECENKEEWASFFNDHPEEKI